MKKIDASGLILGRMSSYVAKSLLKGEQIVIVNAENAIVSGKRDLVIKEYFDRRSKGKIRKGPYYPRTPDQILKHTVRGMVPYQKAHGREAMDRLMVYIGIPREMAKDKFETIAGASSEGVVDFVELGEICKTLGADF
jgi:large subunit ribosomal protein L13